MLDRLTHHLPLLRPVPTGDPCLLAGKLVALFNIRTQQWQTLRYVRNALAQGAWLALPLLAQVLIGSLLLFAQVYQAWRVRTGGFKQSFDVHYTCAPCVDYLEYPFLNER